jgi:hypothetical protein
MEGHLSHDPTNHTENDPPEQHHSGRIVGEALHAENNPIRSEESGNNSNGEPTPVEMMLIMGRAIKKTLIFSKKHAAGIGAVTTVLIFLGTSAYTFVSYLQWDALENQLNNSQATQSAELVIDKVSVDDFETSTQAKVIISNVGLTSARKIIFQVPNGHWDIHDEEGLMDGDDFHKMESLIKSPEPADWGFTLGAGKQKCLTFAISSTLKDLITQRKGEYEVVLFGYEDVFGHSKWAHACIIFERKTRDFQEVDCEPGRPYAPRTP